MRNILPNPDVCGGARVSGLVIYGKKIGGKKIKDTRIDTGIEVC